jgi:hypothetical protein
MTTRNLTTQNFEIGDLVIRVRPDKRALNPQEAGVVLKRYVKSGRVLNCLVRWNSGRTVPIKAAALKCAGESHHLQENGSAIYS